MFIFIVGFFIQLLLTSPAFIIFIYYKSTASHWIRGIVSFYPPFSLAKCVYDITQLSFNYGSYKGTGFSWDNLFNWNFVNQGGMAAMIPPTLENYYLLVINGLIFAILTWFFENTLAGESFRSPIFFLTKDYWGEKRRITSAIPKGDLLIRGSEDPKSVDPDVKEEDRSVLKNPYSDGVSIMRLSKTYKKYPIIKTKKDNLALDNLSLNIPAGTLICLLGHNGAGKTTS